MMTRLFAMQAIWQSSPQTLAELYGCWDIRDIDTITWGWIKWLDKEGDKFVSYDIINWWHIYTRETADDNMVNLKDTENLNINLPF